MKPNGGSFGRVDVKSFIQYKASNGRPNKAQLGKGKKKKKEVDENSEKDVVINIGLMTWDVDNEILKEKRGKRLPVRVPISATYKVLLERATEKWKNVHSNCYEEGQEYVLLLEDGQEAQFMPGSKQFFTLRGYKEELLKDYKRMTLFLCTLQDHSLRENGGEEESKMTQVKRKRQEFGSFDDLGEAGPSGLSCTSTSTRTSRQIESDEEVAMALQQQFDQGKGEDKGIQDAPSMINVLEQRVLREGNDMFIVINRKAPLQRSLTLWKRAANKVSPEHIIRVKCIGEYGIDSGALSKEFLTETVSNIGMQLFPNGSPLYSTNDIHSGNFRACGEVVAASLAQGGPPPCFLDEKVYDTLVRDSAIDFTSPNLDHHLTQSEMQLLEQIKGNVSDHKDTIIDHGYTSVINQGNLKSIVASVVVSILSRRNLCMNEFGKGMTLYGLKDMVSEQVEVARSLFVLGQQEVVDANYVVSLLKPECSEEGSSRRAVEKAMMDFFQDFLMDIEDNRVTGYSESLAWASKETGWTSAEDDDDNIDVCVTEENCTPDVTPAGVLGWLTGQKHREMSGELEIKVMFDHECLKRNPKHTQCYPVVGACGRTITLPSMHMNTQESFREVFLLAFSKGQAFGMS